LTVADDFNILDQGSAAAGAATPAVRITALGTISPVVELAAGSTATVTWTVEETGVAVTGLSPTISISGTQHVLLTAVDTGGRNALADLTTINFGFDHTQDVGNSSLSAGYDHSPQSISAVGRVREMTGLVRFLAANITTLTGTIDFTGLSWLQSVECYGSRVQSVNLSGCTSLVRVCLESNDLASVNLGPALGGLTDFRAAAQRGGTLTMVPWPGDLASLYHFCGHGQVIAFDLSKLTVVEELLIWNTGQSGAFAPQSAALRAALAYDNNYTTADLTGQFPAGRANCVLDLHGNLLTAVTLDGCDGLSTIDLSDNDLDEAAIDAILAEAASWGTSNGSIDLTSNAAPSGGGATAALTLAGRGWTVDVDEAPLDPDLGVLSDDFERTAANVAALGNGWHAVNSATATSDGHDLVRTDEGDYRILLNPAQGTLSANYSVTATVAGAFVNGSYFGLVGRWKTNNGVRLLFANSSTDIHVGDASGPWTNNISLSTPSFPASWSNSGIDHTITMHMSGTTITIEIDGHTVCSGTCTTNAAETGTEWGNCGVGSSLHWRSMGTTQP
jgi:hypothetical protein